MFVCGPPIALNPLYIKGAGVAAIGFFGLCGIYCCIKIFDMKPGLIIDLDGIVDNSNVASMGRIRWDEILGMRVTVMHRQRMVILELVDPQSFIERAGPIVRKLHSANMSLMGSPVGISSNSLAVDFDDLVRLLTEAFERYKNAEGTTNHE